MKILMIHNHYRRQGGEDAVVETESRLLENHGHNVIEYSRSNEELAALSSTEKFAFMLKDSVWNRSAYLDVKQMVRKAKPDIAHVHNVFLQMSPSIYMALWEENIPIVQTIHNYRFFCPKATFFRDGNICEKCAAGNFLYSVFYKCWRGSAVQSFFLQRVLSYHRQQGTFSNLIDRYIALTEFTRRKFIARGFDAERISVKPNCVESPGAETIQPAGRYALFAGRLAEEKGIRTLLQAWKDLPQIPLKIVGDGELIAPAQKFIQEEHLQNVEIWGRVPNEELRSLMAGASFLVFPSEWYECFPVTIIEAFAAGLPVVAARLGAMEEIIQQEETGLCFEPGNATDLALKVKWAWEHPQEMTRLGKKAREEYENKYTPEKNYQALMKIYAATIGGYKQRMSVN